MHTGLYIDPKTTEVQAPYRPITLTLLKLERFYHTIARVIITLSHSLAPCPEAYLRTSHFMQPSEFQVLRATLNTALDAFETALNAENLPSPSIQTCKPHPLDDSAFLPSPALYEARRIALSTMVSTYPKHALCSP